MHCDPSCDCGKWVEIWNNVFMEFNRNAEGKFEKLSQRNVDTGMGLERTICMLNGFKSVYETDLFAGAIAKIGLLAGKKYGENEEDTRAMRIIADHIRTATFLLGDERGIAPSNVDQGYVLRRLIRRSVRFARQLNIAPQDLVSIAKLYIEQYQGVYEELKLNSQKIYDELEKEIDKFSKTLEDGIKQLDKVLQL